MFKSIPFSRTEDPHLEIRFETFNTFNHTQFNGIDTGFTDGNFGQVTSTYDPREFTVRRQDPLLRMQALQNPWVPHPCGAFAARVRIPTSINRKTKRARRSKAIAPFSLFTPGKLLCRPGTPQAWGPADEVGGGNRREGSAFVFLPSHDFEWRQFTGSRESCASANSTAIVGEPSSTPAPVSVSAVLDRPSVAERNGGTADRSTPAAPLLREHEFQFVTGLHDQLAGLRADADPVHRPEPQEFHSSLWQFRSRRMQGFDQLGDPVAAAARLLCTQQNAVPASVMLGQAAPSHQPDLRLANFPPPGPSTPTKSVSQNLRILAPIRSRVPTRNCTRKPAEHCRASRLSHLRPAECRKSP